MINLLLCKCQNDDSIQIIYPQAAGFRHKYRGVRSYEKVGGPIPDWDRVICSLCKKWRGGGDASSYIM